MSAPARTPEAGAARVPFSEICDRLNADPELVLERYCSVAGAWRDRQGRHWCLSPVRPDRTVGSFYVNLHGAYTGRWRDEAGGAHGDMLDLIQRAEPCDKITAIRIAKALLGIDDTSPELRAAMARRAEDRQRRRARETAALAERKRAFERAAQALWLSAVPAITGTPAEFYLAARGIDLRALGRQPRSLRFHPACRFQGHDPETGEVIEGAHPAMLAAIVAVDGAWMGCHRTYLADRRGRWGKLLARGAKLSYGSKREGAIRCWSGAGPRGGKGCPIAEAPPGQRLYLTEGIEDALSVAMLKPDARVWAAIDLGNMATVRLPGCVAEVVLCADNDLGDAARLALGNAVEAHARAGRLVRVWRNEWGGKDVNDALLAAARDPDHGLGDAGHAA